jgi:hypothetical protein
LTTNSCSWLLASQHTIALHRRYCLFVHIIFLGWGISSPLRSCSNVKGHNSFECLLLMRNEGTSQQDWWRDNLLHATGFPEC